MCAMQPVADELLPAAAFRLRDLRLVMRKDVVHPAAMNVELFAEQSGRHRAALDVPARAPTPPRALPPNGAILFVPRLPKREIADVLLVVLVALHPARGAQFREIEMREVTVFREAIDPEVNRLVVRLVGQLARNQF